MASRRLFVAIGLWKSLMHAEALDFVQRSVAGLTPRNVVEIGALYTEYARPVDKNPLRVLFPDVERYVGIDVRPGPGVDVVADGAAWQPDGWQPDLVLCCEVLEHVPPATQRAIVENAYRMLAEDGLLIITAAMEPRKPHTWDGHEQGARGVDYWNVNDDDLYVWLWAAKPRAVFTVDTHDRGDVYVVAKKAPVHMAAVL